MNYQSKKQLLEKYDVPSLLVLSRKIRIQNGDERHREGSTDEGWAPGRMGIVLALTVSLTS